MAYLTLKNINKIYPNGYHAVHNFNLEIEKGEFVVFVGPSGCGKSTTLRMIAGLEDISNGEFLINGVRANEMGPREREVAMVFQSYALYPQMTVYDNIAFGLTLQGVDEEIIEKRVNKTAKILGLTDYLDRLPRALSGGQRQRVAIGRAIIRKVGIFLMDEPLSNLDAKQRVTMRYEIAQIHQETGATTIYVTHDQTEAMTLADRIVIMKDGYIMQVGTPEECFDMPKNLFVAEFIGAPKMNVMETELIREGGKYYVTPFGSKILVDGVKGEMLAKAGAEPGGIILGVRPEHIVLSRTGENAIPCTLEVNEMMGSELHLHVFTEDGTRLIVRVPTIDLTHEDRESLVRGKKLFISFEGKVMHFFDKESQKNLLLTDA